MKLRDLLELCRVSNLPTVWSNAVMGVFAGALIREIWKPDAVFVPNLANPWDIAQVAAIFAVAISLLYCGGMILNDYMDRAIDAQERPGRPIPAGRIKAETALAISVLCLAFGLGLVWISTLVARAGSAALWAGSALLISIIAYNLVHAKTAASVLLMGLCRGLVVLTGAAVLGYRFENPYGWAWVIAPAASLVVYTVLISLVARRETEADRSAGPKTVMNMIAAMPLLDAVWLIVMGLWPASLFSVGCAVLTKLGHRRVAGS